MAIFGDVNDSYNIFILTSKENYQKLQQLATFGDVRKYLENDKNDSNIFTSPPIAKTLIYEPVP